MSYDDKIRHIIGDLYLLFRTGFVLAVMCDVDKFVLHFLYVRLCNIFHYR